jgi:hypothetical protein
MEVFGAGLKRGSRACASGGGGRRWSGRGSARRRRARMRSQKAPRRQEHNAQGQHGEGAALAAEDRSGERHAVADAGDEEAPAVDDDRHDGDQGQEQRRGGWPGPRPARAGSAPRCSPARARHDMQPEALRGAARDAVGVGHVEGHGAAKTRDAQEQRDPGEGAAPRTGGTGPAGSRACRRGRRQTSAVAKSPSAIIAMAKGTRKRSQ